jgi:tagaturonate reductase
MADPMISASAATPPGRLSRAWLEQSVALPSNVTCGPRRTWPERVVQFGEGNFLRAFGDWMLDVLNERGLFGGSVVVVQPIRQGLAPVLNAQDGLYTLLLRGMQDGRVTEQRRIVTSVSRALNPYESWEKVARCFCSPEIRYVISNTTEAGIAFTGEACRPGQCPESFPAKVTALLHERFKAQRGEPASGLIFLPCELIERNGTALRELVLRHAENWGLGRPFAEWVSASNHFLNTLVDRIVPGYPRDEAPQLTRELGYEDALLDAAEWFHLWVIEGPSSLAEELPFHRAGLNVVWTSDLAPYRTRKVRILNGAHTASVLAAFHGGLNLVREMMEDPIFGPFVRRAVFDEIVPTVPLNERERTDYAHAVLERFQNPFVRHELLSISLNSVSKWKVRVLPSLLDFAQARGALPPRLCFSLAALIHFYRGERKSATELTGRREGQTYAIRDEAAVLDVFQRVWGEFDQHRNPRTLTAAVLGHAPFWDRDLNNVSNLAEIVAESLGAILQSGVRPAVAKLSS